MNRPLIFLAAAASAALAVTTACLAEVRGSDRPFRADDIHFTLAGAQRGEDVTLRLRTMDDEGQSTRQTTLAKLGLAPLALDRSGPITLASSRAAGRLDCHGAVRDRMARGTCRFTADAQFNQMLTSRGFARPTPRDSYVMTMVDVSPDLVDAIARSTYRESTIDDLVALAAVGVTPGYIASMDRQSYRPRSIDDLVAFKAVGITSDYVQGLARAGITTFDAEDIVALRAIGVTPDFIAGFARIGYAALPASKLIELKALDVTPAMVQALDGGRSTASLAQREAARALAGSRRR